MDKTITDVVRDIGRAGRLQAALTLSDAQLLERFAVQRDDAAFEALLHRHGPLVFSVCRRLLFDAHDAEDAFQATFLVLARKAAGIGQRSLLGNWLYGVAYKVAARARKQALRRSREQAGDQLNALSCTEQSAEPDEAPLLHEELQRLPDKYRHPVVLCYLEGKTNEEAATHLQWPVGTVKTRLNKARELLRTRLARRGVALSAGLLAAHTATAPAELLASTFQAGVSFAAGDAAAGGLATAQAVALSKGVLQTMLLTKLKLTAALVLSVLVIGGAIGSVVYNALAVEPVASQDDRAKSAPKDDKVAIRGAWAVEAVESEGKDASDRGEGKMFKESTWTITDDKMVVKFGTVAAEMKFKLDPAASPKAIDCTMVAAPNNEVVGKTFPGVYSLDGDTLRIHLPNESNLERPTLLETKAGGGMTMMLVLKRQAKAK